MSRKIFERIGSVCSRFNKNLLEQIYWFLYLLSWIPVISSFSLFPDFIGFFTEGRDTINVILPEQKFFYHPVIGYFLICAIITATIAIILRKYSYLTGSLFLLISCFIFVFNNTQSFSGVQAVVYTIYLLAFCDSVYFFLRHGHLISYSFISFTIVLILDSVLVDVLDRLLGVTADLSVFGTILNIYNVSIFNVIAFVFVSVLIRLVYLMYTDNRGFIASLKPAILASTLRRTALLWFPMLLFYAFFTAGYFVLFNYYFEPKITAYLNQNNPNLAEVDPANYPKDMESALLSANQGALDTIGRQSQASVKRAADAAKESTQDAPDAAVAAVNEAMPERMPGTEPSDCGFLDIVCYIGNGFKSATNAAYVKVKERQTAVLRHELVKIRDDTNAGADEKAGRINTVISTEIAKIQSMIRTGIVSIFQAYAQFSILMAIYSLIVLLKTYLIVFSRVIFAPNPDKSAAVVAAFKPKETESGKGALKKFGDRYAIKKSAANTFYVARTGVTLEGVAPARRNPLRFTAGISRILHGKWALNMIPGKRSGPDETDAIVRVDQPAEIVEWKLGPGEEVIFSFADFIGMSADLTVHRMVSVAIPTMIFGRMIFHCAEGPGVLLLKSTAAARVSPEKQAENSASSTKLLAWDVTTRFNVIAALTVIDTFLSDYNLRKSSGDNVVWDSSVTRGNTRSAGIIRFAKSFMLPI